MRLIGILGGTFDPVHYGHIRLTLETFKQLQLDQVRLIPLNIPPHRHAPVASTEDRIKMLELAIIDRPELCLDLRELEKDDVSYTINTLISLKKEHLDDSLYLILGRDAFNKIDTWKDWQEILDYAHIIVANRSGESNKELSTDLNKWINTNQIEDTELLTKNTHGHIYFIDIPLLDISSSNIKALLSNNKSVADLLPANIISYIKENKLYLEAA